MRRLVVALVASCALLGAACSESEDDPRTDGAADDGTVDDGGAGSGGETDGSEAGSAVVEVLDPGSEPRQELRLQVAADCSVPATVHQDQEIEVNAGGQNQSTSTVSELDITYVCEEVADGRITVASRYDDTRVVEADELTRPALEEILDQFEGEEGRVIFNERGEVLDLETPDIDIPGLGEAERAALLEGFESQGGNLGVPFPEEAVGVGARWTVTSDGELSGLRFRQVTTVTLRSIEGNAVNADLEIELDFPPGPIELPGVDDGEAEVLEGHLTGTGTVSWDLAGPISFGTQRLEGSTRMRFVLDDEETELEQSQIQEVTISAR